MNFRIGDVVKCQGHLAVVVAHKLYDANRDGYVLEYLNPSVLAPNGRGDSMVLPEDLTLVNSRDKNQKSG